MIDITIGTEKYQLKTSTEITIGEVCDILDFCDANEPDEKEDNMRVWLDYYAKYISFVTGAPLSLVRKCKAEDIAGVYGLHHKYLFPAEDKTFNCFELLGELYYLPERLMIKSTIEDYAEADEYQNQTHKLLNGYYKALPKVCAVLCRKKGEGFGDYEVEERAELFENNLSLHDAVQVGFFLQRLSEKSQIDSQIYTTSLTIDQLKQALKN